VGNASVILRKDIANVRGVQTAHLLLSNAAGSEGIREGACKIYHCQRIRPVSARQALATGVDPQDDAASRSRESCGRQKMANVRNLRRVIPVSLLRG
jgi:hypothetical protein